MASVASTAPSTCVRLSPRSAMLLFPLAGARTLAPSAAPR
jgi:hypothetical protein